MGIISGGNVIAGSGRRVIRAELGSPVAADADRVLAAYTDDGAAAVFPADQAFAAQPDVPRNITATAGGTAGDIAAIQVTITGTNVNDESITETLPAFTVNTAGIVTGAKAFKTVTQIDIPAHDGTGATTSVGVGSVLGLPSRISANRVLNAYFGGVVEGTAPTVVADNDELEKNTVDLNSTLDGSAVEIDYVAE